MAADSPQHGNVGNIGDILKHAALVQLAELFATQSAGRIYYLDTHSYLYQSRPAYTAWREQSAALLEPAVYAAYMKLEEPYIRRGAYLCSSGIINTLFPDAHLLLSESDPSTRDRLLAQLAEHRVRRYTVKTQLTDWISQQTITALDNLLILVDPFRLDRTVWQAVSQLAGRLLEKGAPGMMLVFDYGFTSDIEWPAAPPAWCGPIAGLSKTPFHLALYATETCSEAVQRHFSRFGWDMADASR